MKKITPLARVIDIFSTCSPQEGEQLLEAATQLLRSRRDRNQPTRRRGKGAETEPKGDA